MNRVRTQNLYQKARKLAGLTQEEAIEHLPFELRTLQGYEEGQHQPKFNYVCAMAKLYGCSVNAFAPQGEAGEDV